MEAQALPTPSERSAPGRTPPFYFSVRVQQLFSTLDGTGVGEAAHFQPPIYDQRFGSGGAGVKVRFRERPILNSAGETGRNPVSVAEPGGIVRAVLPPANAVAFSYSWWNWRNTGLNPRITQMLAAESRLACQEVSEALTL